MKKFLPGFLLFVACSACVREGDSVHMSYVYDPDTDLCFTITPGSPYSPETFSNVPCTPKVLARIKAENKIPENKQP